MKFDVDNVYKLIKKNQSKYREEKHCKLLLEIMADPNRGRISAFCVEVSISEDTFYNWIHAHPLFAECYSVAKMHAREAWEKEGYIIKDIVRMPGMISNEFEHWKMIGWSRFGISKNSRIKLNLNPADNPSQHYSQLLTQASKGDFTASEIKQLMEAVNVGLNAHQVFELQEQIDQLKSDLATMTENNNVKNSFTNTGLAQKD